MRTLMDRKQSFGKQTEEKRQQKDSPKEDFIKIISSVQKRAKTDKTKQQATLLENRLPKVKAVTNGRSPKEKTRKRRKTN